MRSVPVRIGHNPRREHRIVRSWSSWSLLLAVGTADRSSTAKTNVWGRKLQSCSRLGIAMAGDYPTIRSGGVASGFCSGNYTICVDLGQDGKDALCQGLDHDAYLDSDRDDMEWLCSQETLPCHDQSSELCPIESWCLSPDVFAAYVEDAGACSDLQGVECASVSSDAVWALLDPTVNTTARREEALACLVDRCNMYGIDALATSPNSVVDVAGYGAALLGVFLAALLFMYRTYREPSDAETVVAPKELSSATFDGRPSDGGVGSETSYVLEETNEVSSAAVPVSPFGTAFLTMLISAVVVMVRRSAPLADQASRALPGSSSNTQVCERPASESFDAPR